MPRRLRLVRATTQHGGKKGIKPKVGPTENQLRALTAREKIQLAVETWANETCCQTARLSGLSSYASVTLQAAGHFTRTETFGTRHISVRSRG